MVTKMGNNSYDLSTSYMQERQGDQFGQCSLSKTKSAAISDVDGTDLL